MMRDIDERTCQSCNGQCCGNGKKLTNGTLKPVSSLGDLVQWDHIDEDEKPSIFWYDRFEMCSLTVNLAVQIWTI